MKHPPQAGRPRPVGRPPSRRDSGFALLLVFLMAAVIALFLYKEIPRVGFEAQRQKEQLLVYRGEQYKRGIQVFFRKNGRLPAKIEDLENTNNQRFLRRRYIDPMTGKDEWRMVHAQNGVLTDSVNNKPGTDPNKQQKEGWQASGYIGETAGLGQAMTGTGQPGAGGPNFANRRRPSDGNPNGGQMPGGADPNAVAYQPPGGIQPGTGNPAGMVIGPNGQPLPGSGQPMAPGMPGYPGNFGNPAGIQQNLPGVLPQVPGGGGVAGVINPGMISGGPGGRGFQPGITGTTNPNTNTSATGGGGGYLGGGGSYLGSGSYLGGSGTASGSASPLPGQPGFNQPGMNQPGMNQQGFNQPVFNQQGLNQQGFNQQGQNQPGFNQPGMNQPGFGQNNSGQAGFNQPSGFPPGIPVNSQTGGVSAMPGSPYSTSAGANGTAPNFQQPGVAMNPQAQNAATQMIGNLLTQPRPGGMPPANTAGLGLAGMTGIVGFASTADQDGIMVYNDHTNYHEWEFIFDPTKVKPLANPNGANIGIPASQMPGAQGGTPGVGAPGMSVSPPTSSPTTPTGSPFGSTPPFGGRGQ